MKEAKSVEKVRAEQKLSYRDALRVVRGSQRELHKPQFVPETRPRATYPMNDPSNRIEPLPKDWSRNTNITTTKSKCGNPD
jgi:hypothetical protein